MAPTARVWFLGDRRKFFNYPIVISEFLSKNLVLVHHHRSQIGKLPHGTRTGQNVLHGSARARTQSQEGESHRAGSYAHRVARQAGSNGGGSRVQDRRSFWRPWRQGPQGCRQVQQSRRSVRDVDRPRPQAPLALGQAERRRSDREILDQVVRYYRSGRPMRRSDTYSDHHISLPFQSADRRSPATLRRPDQCAASQLSAALASTCTGTTRCTAGSAAFSITPGMIFKAFSTSASS